MPLLLAPPRYRTVNDESGSSCLSSRDGDGDTDGEPRYHVWFPQYERSWSETFWVWFHRLKILFLAAVLLFAVVTMSFIEEEDDNWHKIHVSPGNGSVLVKLEDSPSPVRVFLRGPFLSTSLASMTNISTSVTLVGVLNQSSGELLRIKEILRVPTVSLNKSYGFSDSVVDKVFSFHQFGMVCQLLVEVAGTLDASFSMQVRIAPSEHKYKQGLVMAAVVLAVLYILIIFELVHRTLAALIGATMAVTFVSLIGERPSLVRVVSWLDVETLCLLFGMMVLVGILCETGFFDCAAVLAYRLARGKVWPMISMLCLFAGVISAFLDNVTTILLMTPVTIKLCEVMNLDPKHVLIILVLYSNIGGAATPVGDPPNVIIISNPKVKSLGIDFSTFTAHMMPGIILCALGAFAYLRFVYRDPRKLGYGPGPDIVEIQHEIDIWRKAVHSLSEYSRDESHVRDVLSKKVRKLVRQKSKKSAYARSTDENFQVNLRELSEKYKIRNWPLLVKSGIVLFMVILLFFMQSVPNLHLSLGWIAILGSVTLMILADLSELEGIIARVEWTTLIFFGALFVVMEALSELKLLLFVGNVTETWIRGVSSDSRLAVSILIITWVSSIVSSCVDNIPFTTVMIKIVAGLGDSDLGVKLIPLVYALAFGACLGGNGTLIGASANVVCAGVAEQHGYKFSFMEFFKVGFPVMLLTTAISTGWLMLCHVVLGWDS